MRTRNHEIKLRLNDRELVRLNDMVERSIFSREEFLRRMLAGFTICEAPTEYRAFRFELIRKMNEIRTLLRETPMTDDRAELKELLQETGAVIRRMDGVYTPYYREKDRTWISFSKSCWEREKLFFRAPDQDTKQGIAPPFQEKDS